MTFVACHPFLIAVVEPLEVVHAHGLLVGTTSFLYLLYQIGDTGTDIDHEVGETYEGNHGGEQVGVVGIVTVAHQSHVMEIGGEYARIFKDGAVLDDDLVRLGDIHYFLETFGQKVDLEMERLAGHVLIVVLQIGIVVHGLKAWCPIVTAGQHLGKGGLAASYVSCDGYMHNFGRD